MGTGSPSGRGGMSTGGFGTGTGSTDVVTTDWYVEFLQQFPGWANLISHAPELKGIIGDWWNDTATGGDYNSLYNGLRSAVTGSTWWQTTEEPLRDNLLLRSEDPATWAANNETTRQNIISAADTLGVRGVFSNIYSNPKYQGTSFWGTDYFKSLSEEAERNGWTTSQISTRLSQDALALGYTPTRGAIKRDMERISSYAGNMLTDIDPDTTRQWAHRMNSAGGMFDDGGNFLYGSMTWEEVQDAVQGIANTTWGFMDIEDLAGRGLTLSDVFSDVKSTIAGTLELNSEDINLQAMGIENLTKGEGEGRRMINKDDAKNWAKKQSMYQGTDAFRKDVRGLTGAWRQLSGRGPSSGGI